MPEQGQRPIAPTNATAWFAVLEGARNRGDYELAAKAQRQLKRLGVNVHFDRPDRKGGVQ
jgi:hypothetical protein